MKKLNNKTVGMICVVLGGIFFVAGIVLFILYNSVNLYAQKADATIVSRYKIESEEDPHTMLELAYRVGDEMVYTAESVYEDIPEDEVNREIYYNVKNPKEILDAGWHFEPIIPSGFGVIILLTGLYYMGIVTFGLDVNRKPGAKATEWDKKFFDAKERVENNLVPLLGVASFIVFGVFMLVKKSGWWAWIFVVLGTIGALYFLLDLIPAISEFSALKKMRNFKGRAVSVDDDFEKFEKNKGELEDKKNKKKDKEEAKEEVKEEKPEDFEVEETYEIKSLDVKKKRKKK